MRIRFIKDILELTLIFFNRVDLKLNKMTQKFEIGYYPLPLQLLSFDPKKSTTRDYVYFSKFLIYCHF